MRRAAKARALLKRALVSLPPVKAFISYALAAAAGTAAHFANVPLAWILGPLLATAIAAIAGLPTYTPVAWRRFGQVTIGTSIGLNVTAPVLVTIGLWLPIMMLTAFIAIFLAAIVSVPFARMCGLDRMTAFYAMMPGGLSEMANLGAAAGAQSEPIAVSQALRVALLVCILPPLIVSLGIHGSALGTALQQPLNALHTFTALAVGLAGVGIARILRLNNPWMIGALVAASAAAATGLLIGKIPPPLYWFGQFLIGISIGARFRREIVIRLPRLFITSALFVVVLAVLLFGYAALLSSVTGLDLASAALGASPGGLAEMAITAQSLHLSVGLVTAFHVVRAFFVNAFTSRFWSGFNRIHLFDALEKIADAVGQGRR
jgi:membrane AbrB-like protein